MTKLLVACITGYGSTLYIGIAMVFVFSPYIWKFTSCFQFQVNLTFNDLTAQNLSKVICVPNITGYGSTLYIGIAMVFCIPPIH